MKICWHPVLACVLMGTVLLAMGSAVWLGLHPPPARQPTSPDDIVWACQYLVLPCVGVPGASQRNF